MSDLAPEYPLRSPAAPEPPPERASMREESPMPRHLSREVRVAGGRPPVGTPVVCGMAAVREEPVVGSPRQVPFRW